MYAVRIKSTDETEKKENRLTKGMKVSGYVVITFDEDGDPEVTAMEGVNVMMIAEYLGNTSNEMTSTLWQAIAIAEGLKKARQIREEEKRDKFIEKMIGGMKPDIKPEAIFDDEEDDDDENV